MNEQQGRFGNFSWDIENHTHPLTGLKVTYRGACCVFPSVYLYLHHINLNLSSFCSAACKRTKMRRVVSDGPVILHLSHFFLNLHSICYQSLLVNLSRSHWAISAGWIQVDRPNEPP